MSPEGLQPMGILDTICFVLPRDRILLLVLQEFLSANIEN